jgi:hypothetical protein
MDNNNLPISDVFEEFDLNISFSFPKEKIKV